MSPSANVNTFSPAFSFNFHLFSFRDRQLHISDSRKHIVCTQPEIAAAAILNFDELMWQTSSITQMCQEPRKCSPLSRIPELSGCIFKYDQCSSTSGKLFKIRLQTHAWHTRDSMRHSLTKKSFNHPLENVNVGCQHSCDEPTPPSCFNLHELEGALLVPIVAHS